MSISGCDYPQAALEAIKSWGTPPRDKIYEEKMKEIRDREAVKAEAPPPG